MFEQRFNVAGSRARDRMYLVRSVEVTDLSDKDLRQALLATSASRWSLTSEEAESLVERVRVRIRAARCSRELAQRGYRVIPQVKSGAYRIDMVVEGERRHALAIECDGDEFHGPDRWRRT